MKNRGPILGIAVILITDAVILAGVAASRAREPVQMIELSERELVLPNLSQENSGIDLRLAFYRPAATEGNAHLDRSILERAGFRFQIPDETPAADVFVMPRIAFVAFEYQGKIWEQWLLQAEEEVRRAEAVPSAVNPRKRVPAQETRLFALDAARSSSELRARYPDQNRVLILRAVLWVRVSDVKDPATDAVTGHDFRGYVSEVLPGFIHVPLPYSRLLSGLKSRQPEDPPRYFVTLSFSDNLEPRVTGVRLN
jgi:hypothetical protein